MYELFEKLLKERNISAYKVSKDTGIATATLTDWKKGRSTPKANKLQLIADYFEVPITYFYEDEKNKPLVNNDEELTRYLDELKNRKEMRMLFSVSEGCTKEEVEQAVRIIEALRKKEDDYGC